MTVTTTFGASKGGDLFDHHNGYCAVTEHPDGTITVDQADPRILVSVAFLDSVRAGNVRGITLVDDVLRIDADRVVIYRIGDKVPDLWAYYAEWPD